MNKGIHSVCLEHTDQIQGLFPHKALYRKNFDTFTKQYKYILAQEILNKTSVRVKIVAKILPQNKGTIPKVTIRKLPGKT